MGNSRLLLAVVAASVFSALITALAMGRQADNAPPTTTSSNQDSTQLIATLENLAHALQSFQSQSSPPLSPRSPGPGPVVTPEPIERTPMGESATLNAIARHLEELKGLIGTQSWQGSSGTVELASAGSQHVDADWQAISELKQRLTGDRAGTERSLYFLTPAMVVQRYGRPTRISVRDNGTVTWTYSNRSNNPPVSILFRFMDGYLIETR